MSVMTVVGEGEYAVAGDYLAALQEFAAEKGITPQVLLRDTGIALSALIKPNIRVGHISMTHAVKNLITAIPDPLLAIEYGKRLTISKHGVLGFAAQSSPTLRGAASLLIQFVNTRSGGGEELELIEKNNMACLRIRHESEYTDHAVARFHLLSLFVCLESIGRWLVGKSHEFVETEIGLSFPCIAEIPPEILSPGLTIKFDQLFNELRCPLGYLDQPLIYANAALEAAAQQECEAELVKLRLNSDISSVVRMEIRNEMGRLPSIELIAERLHMSSRTLKRRLQDAGTTYQKIKDDERCRKAMYLLESTGDNLEKIAEQLGYSDASNFTKAFKNWADLSPNEFRVKVQAKS